MSEQDILELVAAFAHGAGRAKRAGFDGVQLHGAHGYLINQFLSPLSNARQDTYGGSLENRMRFLREVYGAVRREVGPSWPVSIKLTAADNIPGGFPLEEAVTVARSLEVWGIDAIEVSSGTVDSGKRGRRAGKSTRRSGKPTMLPARDASRRKSRSRSSSSGASALRKSAKAS